MKFSLRAQLFLLVSWLAMPPRCSSLTGLRAIMSAFGKGPFSAPHRTDLVAVVMTTLLHPVPWILPIGGWFGIRRLIFGPIIPEGWRWFWIGVGCWAILVPALLALMMRRIRKPRAKAEERNCP
jgi:hypothetical protein